MPPTFQFLILRVGLETAEDLEPAKMLYAHPQRLQTLVVCSSSSSVV